MREFKEAITGKDKDDDDDDARPARADDRRDVEAALGRPEGEKAPLEGDTSRERSPR
jgi:sec-independent protein translocase protein TatA